MTKLQDAGVFAKKYEKEETEDEEVLELDKE